MTHPMGMVDEGDRKVSDDERERDIYLYMRINIDMYIAKYIQILFASLIYSFLCIWLNI